MSSSNVLDQPVPSSSSGYAADTEMADDASSDSSLSSAPSSLHSPPNSDAEDDDADEEMADVLSSTSDLSSVPSSLHSPSEDDLDDVDVEDSGSNCRESSSTESSTSSNNDEDEEEGEEEEQEEEEDDLPPYIQDTFSTCDSSDSDVFPYDTDEDPPDPDQLVRRNLDRISDEIRERIGGSDVDDQLRDLLEYFPMESMDMDGIDEMLGKAGKMLKGVDVMKERLWALESAVKRLRRRVRKRVRNDGEWTF